jgi:Flp pilus assembly pilin Flp
MARFGKTLVKARKGAGLVEYGILAGLVSVVAISAVLGLGQEVRDTFAAVAQTVASQGESSDGGQAPAGQPRDDGQLDTYGIQFSWESGQPNQAAAAFFISSTSDPSNPWAQQIAGLRYGLAGDGLVQAGVPVADWLGLNASLLPDPDPASGNGYYGRMAYTVPGTQPLNLTQIVGSETEPWMAFQTFVGEVMASGVPFDPAHPTAVGYAEVLCGLFRPMGSEIPKDYLGGSVQPVVGRIIDQGADTGAPAGRWMFALTCSASGDTAALARRSGFDGSWYPFP